MNLIENRESFFIDNLPLDFPVTAGFSKPYIDGIEIGRDIGKILAKNEFNNFEISHLNQIHSSFVCETSESGIYTADGQITSTKNLVLIVKTADCLPLFVFDNKNKKIGLIHMGWRSAQAGIIDNISVDLSNALVVAGVGLRKCCYRVGEEFLQIDRLAPFVEKKEDFFYLDIINFAKSNLLRRGLKEINFYDLGICSYCSKDRFFSYRRDKTKKRTLSFSVIM